MSEMSDSLHLKTANFYKQYMAKQHYLKIGEVSKNIEI